MKKHDLLTHTPLDVALRALQTPIAPVPTLTREAAAQMDANAVAPPTTLAAALAAKKE